MSVGGGSGAVWDKWKLSSVEASPPPLVLAALIVRADLGGEPTEPDDAAAGGGGGVVNPNKAVRWCAGMGGRWMCIRDIRK